jgi:hypothetical protein
MEKHLTLVGVLNIVYRGLLAIEALVLFILSAGFHFLIDALIRSDFIEPYDIPAEAMGIVPVILLIVGTITLVVSAVGIIGAIGVLKRKEWARIVLLVISFFNLMHIPFGTALGIYSIWVLFKDKTIQLFRPSPLHRTAKSKT